MKKIIVLTSFLFTLNVFAQDYPEDLPQSADDYPSGTVNIAQSIGHVLLTKLRTMGVPLTSAQFAATMPAIEKQAAALALRGVAGSATGIGAVPTWLWLLSGVVMDYTIKMAVDSYFPNYEPPPFEPNYDIRISRDPVVPTAPINLNWKIINMVPNPAEGSAMPMYPTTAYNKLVQSNIFGVSYGDPYEFINGAKSNTTILNNCPNGCIAINRVDAIPYFSNYFGLHAATQAERDRNNALGIVYTTGYTFTMIRCKASNWGDGADEVWPNCSGAVTAAQGSQASTVVYQITGGTCPNLYSWTGNMVSTASWDPGGCRAIPYIQVETNNIKTVDQFLQEMPPNYLDAAVNPRALSDLANELWRLAAAEAGYQGVPYQPYNPLNEWDVFRAYDPAVNQAGASIPRVRDLARPVPLVLSPPSTLGIPRVVSVSLTPNATAPAPAVPLALGPNPAIPTPILEAIPTSEMILAPILGLMPDLMTYTVPSHSSFCPAPSFYLFGNNYKFDIHCSFSASLRQYLYQIMLAVWSIAGVLVILSA